MEDALVHALAKEYERSALNVLILVLMEDALVHSLKEDIFNLFNES